MSKLYLLEAHDFDYGEGYSTEIVVFPDKNDAELLKHKVEQVYQYIEQRLTKFEEKHPDCYRSYVKERLYKTIQKNVNFSYLKDIHYGEYSNNFQRLHIIELEYKETFSEYVRSKN